METFKFDIEWCWAAPKLSSFFSDKLNMGLRRRCLRRKFNLPYLTEAIWFSVSNKKKKGFYRASLLLSGEISFDKEEIWISKEMLESLRRHVNFNHGDFWFCIEYKD